MANRYVVIPAAGNGSRMGSKTPKQYLPLLGQLLLQHTIDIFSGHPLLTQVIVLLAAGEQQPSLSRCEILHCGGKTRAETVLNGLVRLSLAADDWVLVHDAARPCLSRTALDRLLASLENDHVGGLLAIPAADTLKRSDTGQHVIETIPRAEIWQAQTPQMFRYGILYPALKATAEDSITDEAQAVEKQGYAPKLVMGERNNLKVTFPEDLEMAEMILRARY